MPERPEFSRDGMADVDHAPGQPGHLIRRANQILSALWSEHVGTVLTSAQYSVLHSLADVPAMDQVSITHSASLDRSTLADVLVRLEAKSLVKRDRNKSDARRNLVSLTEGGRELLESVAPAVRAVEQELVACFTDHDRDAFLAQLRELVSHGEAHLAQRGDGRSDGRVDGASDGHLVGRADSGPDGQVDGDSD